MVVVIKIRIFVFLSTLIIVGLIGTFVSFYARGYKFDFKNLRFQPNGILVIKSEPDGASVFVNSNLKTATNATISLPPGTYDIEVKKEGYLSWYKRVVIEKEIVTQAAISLFKTVPSLSPETLDGADSPTMSPDGTKIAYIVPAGKDIDAAKTGLWTVDTYSLPLGFSNSPKRVTDGDLTEATYLFSPDGRQIMLTISNSVFLLDSGSFTGQDQRINIASKKEAVLAQWQREKQTKDSSLTRGLPQILSDILNLKSHAFVFSPDENMILYTASASASLPDNLIKQLPGASTQKQERNIGENRTYVYDIKEDRNFLITNQEVTINNQPSIVNGSQGGALRWLSTSRHLLLAGPNQVAIMDYDGTNRQVVYSGSYSAPFAFPFTNTTKLLILTNLGASSTPNLYTLTVK